MEAGRVEQLREKMESLNARVNQNNEEIMEKLIKMEANYESCSEVKSRAGEYKKLNNRYQRVKLDYEELESEYKAQREGVAQFVESRSKGVLCDGVDVGQFRLQEMERRLNEYLQESKLELEGKIRALKE